MSRRRAWIPCRLPDCSGGGVDPQFAELAVESRAADPEPPRDLRHPTAIMADRQPDDVRLDLLERAEVPVASEQSDDRSAGDHLVAAGLADVGREIGTAAREARLDRDVGKM